MSRDKHVHIHSGSLVQHISKALLLVLITLLLLLPIIICNLANTVPVRIAVVLTSTIVYLLIVSTLLRPKTMELLLAAVTYVSCPRFPSS